MALRADVLIIIFSSACLYCENRKILDCTAWMVRLLLHKIQ